MISIIISSYNAEHLAAIQENIGQTIGVPFELIVIENPNARLSLCEVYNQGASRASNDIVCFAHEDMLFKTTGWGSTVVSMFAADHELGLIGVAGSSIKTAAPSSFVCVDDRYNYMNVLQHWPNQKKPVSLLSINPAVQPVPVVCVDGLWFCTTKKVLSTIKFDGQTFHHFHCYDLDFSLRVSQHYRVLVTFDILIEHFSDGKWDKQWLDETLIFVKKWKGKLPLSIEPGKYEGLEVQSFLIFLNRMNELGYPPTRMTEAFRDSYAGVPLSIDSRFRIKYRLFKEYIKQALKRY